MNGLNSVKAKISTAFQNPDNKELVSSAALIFLLKIVFAFMAFLVSIVITRYLSVAEAGFYFFMLSVLSIASTVGSVGLDNAIVRFMAVANNNADHVQVRRIFSLSIALALSGGLLLSVLLCLIYILGNSVFFQTVNTNAIVWMACIIPITILTSVLVQSFQGIKRIFLYASFGGVIRPLNLLVLLFIILVSGGLSLYQAFWTYLLVSLCILMLAYLSWKRIVQSTTASAFNTNTLGTSFKTEFYRCCFSMWGIACLAIVMGQGAMVLVGMFSSQEQVAYFAVATRIALLVSFVLLAINGILSPKFAEIFAQNDTQRLKQLYRSSTKMMIMLSAPFLVLIFIFSPEILLLFGSDYQPATSVLRLLVAAQFIKVLVGSVGQLLIMANLQKSQRNNLILSVSILVVLTLYLVPQYGALGAAIGSFAAMTVNNLLGLRQVYKILNISVF